VEGYAKEVFVLSGGNERDDCQPIITACGNVQHWLCPGKVGVCKGSGASE
jgi:hypothetical protein